LLERYYKYGQCSQHPGAGQVQFAERKEKPCFTWRDKARIQHCEKTHLFPAAATASLLPDDRVDTKKGLTTEQTMPGYQPR